MAQGRPIEYMTPSEALDFAASLKIFLSIPTITKWAIEFGFGHQLGGYGGKWYINKVKFKNFLHNRKEDD